MWLFSRLGGMFSIRCWVYSITISLPWPKFGASVDLRAIGLLSGPITIGSK